ncbi:hypothetical protein HPB47_019439, partial [Ixodes persulcatus]
MRTADVKIVKKNLDILISVGLGERAKADLNLCKHTCSVLMQLANEIKSAKDPPPRLEPSSDIFVKLKEVLLETFSDTTTEVWSPAMEMGTNLVYKLSSRPDQFANDLLQGIAAKCFGAAPDGHAPSSGTENGEAASEAATGGHEESVRCPDVVLCRLLACVGHVGLRQLIYLDVDVYTEMKRLREVAKDEKEKSVKRNKRKSFSATGSGMALSVRAAPFEHGACYAPLTSDDSDAERIIHILDHVVLHEDSILGMMSKIVVEVASKPSVYGSLPVRINASLSLAKLMLINEGFCDEHLPLLFTILDKSSEPVIRSNLVFAMGDLIVRFPNLLAEWTGKIYALLHDPSQEVRLCTLKVLSFLILNDLVKVKNQISELAVLVIDADPQVARVSREFFGELGKKARHTHPSRNTFASYLPFASVKKGEGTQESPVRLCGNALYNILPDIISHLSNPNGGIDEESFHSVMRLLFACIDKDRQLEGFVDKLCLRFLTV